MIKKFDKKKLISRIEFFIDLEAEMGKTDEVNKILLDLKKFIMKNDTKKIKYVIEQLNFVTNELISFIDFPKKISKIKIKRK